MLGEGGREGSKGMWFWAKQHCPSSREYGVTGDQTQDGDPSQSESTCPPKVNTIILKAEILEALIM